MTIEDKLIAFFYRTGFDAIEVYYRDGKWTCCIMTGCQGEDKVTIEAAIESAMEEQVRPIPPLKNVNQNIPV